MNRGDARGGSRGGQVTFDQVDLSNEPIQLGLLDQEAARFRVRGPSRSSAPTMACSRSN